MRKSPINISVFGYLEVKKKKTAAVIEKNFKTFWWLNFKLRREFLLCLLCTVITERFLLYIYINQVVQRIFSIFVNKR